MIRILLLVAIQWLYIAAQNPGYRMRLTTKGLNYASNVSGSYITKLLRTSAIPAFTDDWHGVHFNVNTIDIKFFKAEAWDYQLKPPSKFSYVMSEASMNASGRLNVSYKLPIYGKIGFHVDVNASATGGALNMTASLGKDDVGHPTATVVDCSFDMDWNLKLRFSGSKYLPDFLLKLVEKGVAHLVKPKLVDLACTEGKSKINEELKKELSTLQTSYTFYKNWTVDYSLSKAPVVGTSYIEAEGKGMVLFDHLAPPSGIPRPPVDESGLDDAKMANLWATEYWFNVVFYSLDLRDTMAGWIDKDLSPQARAFLATTCTAPEKCIGSFIKDLSTLYPNRYAKLFVFSTAPATAHITDSGMHFHDSGDVSVTMLEKGEDTFVAKANYSIDALVQLKVRDGDFYALFNITSCTTSQTMSIFKDPIKWKELCTVGKNLIEVQLNRVFTGLPVPQIHGQTITNVDFTAHNRTVQFALDFTLS